MSRRDMPLIWCFYRACLLPKSTFSSILRMSSPTWEVC
jgi:hypothetical protein